MRKLAIALVAAITIGATLPAAAQVGFYAGPGGVGVGVGAPVYDGYGPGYYGYAPGYAEGYGYGPSYGYAPYHRHFHQWRHEPYARSW